MNEFERSCYYFDYNSMGLTCLDLSRILLNAVLVNMKSEYHVTVLCVALVVFLCQKKIYRKWLFEGIK